MFRRSNTDGTGYCLKRSNRVLRGGGWNNNARNCRSANRNDNSPGNRNSNNGFRLVRSPAHQARADAGLLTSGNIPPPQELAKKFSHSGNAKNDFRTPET